MRSPERCGPHARLQHSPPHSGTPPLPPPTATAPQAWPATVQLPVPPGFGWPQRPTVAPCDLLQSPPQHSVLFAQMSPFCAQNDPLAQTPLLQSLEQQSPCDAHALPVVRQAGLSGAHAPFALHMPLQHWAAFVHA